MSTYMYLVCQDHTPPLVAEEESGQHWYDVPQIRADIADRERIVASINDGLYPDDYFRLRTARFLAAHAQCAIGIQTEYGEDVPLVEEDAE